MVNWEASFATSGAIWAVVAPGGTSQSHGQPEGILLTGTNDGDALPFQVVAPVPSGRVHDLSLIVLIARNIDSLWLVQLTSGGDEKVAGDLV